MSVAAVSALEPLAAAGGEGPAHPAASTAEQMPAAAAAERVRQLQALLAEVEHPAAASTTPATPAPTFASALSAAQAGETVAGAGLPTAAQAGGPAAAVAPNAAAYTPLIEQAAARNGIDPALLSGLIQQESGFDPSAHSGAGALGLTQLMPATATALGVANPLDPAQSIEGGARYLSQMLGRFGGNTAEALAAYNAGPGAVAQYGGVPPFPETQQYVSKVLGYAAAFRQAAPPQPTAGAIA